MRLSRLSHPVNPVYPYQLREIIQFSGNSPQTGKTVLQSGGQPGLARSFAADSSFNQFRMSGYNQFRISGYNGTAAGG